MLAYDFPLLSLLLTLLVFFAGVAWIVILIRVFIDNFERRDHSGWAKAGWTIAILLLPLFGVLAYIVVRPVDAE